MRSEIETLNMHTAPLTQITKQIAHQLEDGDYTPVTLLGKSGIGKTESIRDLAADLGIGFIELRLSHYQESDLIGLPYIDAEGKTRHAVSDLLPDERDEGQGILLLDEVTSAPKSMRSAVYQLLDIGRRLGEYKLPGKWLVIACGNGPDDGGDFRGIEPAFLSRGFCWRVEENLRVWKDWAVRHRVNPAVIAFLSFKPDMLHVMDLDRPFDMIACPRNWAKLGGLLTNMEARTSSGVIEDMNDLEFAADGCVGCQCGPAFTAFYEFKKNLISPQDILDGKVPPSRMEEVSEEVLYLTAQSLVHEVRTLLGSDENGGFDADSPADADSDNFDDLFDVNIDPAVLEKTANLFNWIIDVGEIVRLDMAVSILQDLSMAADVDLRPIVLADEFDELCPRFAAFSRENYIIL